MFRKVIDPGIVQRVIQWRHCESPVERGVAGDDSGRHACTSRRAAQEHDRGVPSSLPDTAAPEVVFYNKRKHQRQDEENKRKPVEHPQRGERREIEREIERERERRFVSF